LTAYPNPFNPETIIKYRISTAGPVTLAIYDVKGRLVDTLASESKPAGEHSATWSARDAAGRPVASGVYFARLESETQVRTIKVLLLK
jgi:flagellar hook assembly protein FlgD